MAVLEASRRLEGVRQLQRYDPKMDGATANVGDSNHAPEFLGVVDRIVRYCHVPLERYHKLGAISEIVEDSQQQTAEPKNYSADRGNQSDHSRRIPQSDALSRIPGIFDGSEVPAVASSRAAALQFPTSGGTAPAGLGRREPNSGHSLGQSLLSALDCSSAMRDCTKAEVM